MAQMIILGGGRFYRELRNCKSASMAEQVDRLMSLLEWTFTRPLHESLGRLHAGYLNWTPEVARNEPAIPWTSTLGTHGLLQRRLQLVCDTGALRARSWLNLALEPNKNLKGVF